jgi:hypothetical protein
MEGGKHLHCRLLQKGSSKQAGNWTLGSETGFKKPNPDLVGCIEGHELLSSPLPALYLAWDTDHDDLKPRALAGFAGTPEVPIQAIYRSEVVNGEDGIAHANRQTIASYFVSQLFLAAELCLDRNYLSIGLVTEQFPFAHCLAMIQDAELPNELKAAVVRIISTAYVAGQDKGDSTSLQRECSARARSRKSTDASRALREMIARPKISRNERKTAEIGAFEVGNVALLSCPGTWTRTRR